jgi:hypothetical protein
MEDLAARFSLASVWLSRRRLPSFRMPLAGRCNDVLIGMRSILDERGQCRQSASLWVCADVANDDAEVS